ncbi:IclR family transcriptional regulator C-terminal domain-containing protein [Actinophytocola sp.]|uniref:IclR family transcriptional regulator domain-containing protein n=1 Tax=Actinophytocola sp. TaxID=1872138 RepID=UPI0025C4B357|nr:IclR family transcriptional regulator C-terminal domain-containing protein [Actinophytocola sp.]
MLLAGVDPERLTAHLPPEPYPARTDRTITTLDEMTKEIRRTARRGHGIDDNEGSTGLKCVAVPITAGGQMLAALSVSGPAGEFGREKQKEYLERLHETAEALSADYDVVAVLRRMHESMSESPNRRP